MNYWKIAFFIVLFANLILDTILFVIFFGSGYAIIDMSVSLTHLNEGFADCEAHRDLLHELAREQLREPTGAPPTLTVTRNVDGYTQVLEYGDFTARYDADGRYLGSQYGGSVSPGFWALPTP